MQGDGAAHSVVPNTCIEGGIQQLAGPAAYQGFFQDMEGSSRSVDNLHSPPEPAGSSYSSPVFVSVSSAAYGTLPTLPTLQNGR